MTKNTVWRNFRWCHFIYQILCSSFLGLTEHCKNLQKLLELGHQNNIVNLSKSDAKDHENPGLRQHEIPVG